jgi:hypothetical protein
VNGRGAPWGSILLVCCVAFMLRARAAPRVHVDCACSRPRPRPCIHASASQSLGLGVYARARPRPRPCRFPYTLCMVICTRVYFHMHTPRHILCIYVILLLLLGQPLLTVDRGRRQNFASVSSCFCAFLRVKRAEMMGCSY